MKEILLAILLAIACIVPMTTGNGYLQARDFDVVTIKSGDTLNSLAAKYTVNSEDQKELMEAICEINDIYTANNLEVGRQLHIPVIHRSDGSEIARN